MFIQFTVKERLEKTELTEVLIQKLKILITSSNILTKSCKFEL